MFGPFQFGQADLSALIPGAVHSQLLQCQQIGTGAHGASGDHDAGNIDAGHTHQTARHPFITAGQKDSGVKRRGTGLDFDHVRDHFPAGKTVIDAVGSLTFTIAHIRTKISCAMPSGISDALSGGLNQAVQMAASGMAVSESALNKNLRFGQIFDAPAGTQAQRIHLWGEGAHLLTD